MSSKTKERPILYEHIQYRTKYNRKLNIHLSLKDTCPEARTKWDLKARAVTGAGAGTMAGSMGLGVSTGVLSQGGQRNCGVLTLSRDPCRKPGTFKCSPAQAVILSARWGKQQGGLPTAL